ncbi:hypothetical protein ABEB36_011428 [Hypothenemus hampei]|uniref:Secreted protein n=1 Tax=Hypothenemus hampei TaxID=57062 RepID=A0ABD1EFD7_HYPHA
MYLTSIFLSAIVAICCATTFQYIPTIEYNGPIAGRLVRSLHYPVSNEATASAHAEAGNFGFPRQPGGARHRGGGRGQNHHISDGFTSPHQGPPPNRYFEGTQRQADPHIGDFNDLPVERRGPANRGASAGASGSADANAQSRTFSENGFRTSSSFASSSSRGQGGANAIATANAQA